MPWRQLIVPLVAVAVLATGCADRTASVQELERSVVSTRDRVDSALAGISRAQTKDAFLERMDEAAETIAADARRLDGMGAPEGYERQVESLAGALRQLAFDVRATADQIRAPGFDDLLSGVRGLSFESWDEVNLALADLAAKGVDVVPLERH